VVVPTWNCAGILPSCLESLQSQDYPAELLEIVVSDDGSTDGTAKVVEEFQANGKGTVVYVLSPHGGVNAARNAGILASSGEIVGFLDADEVAPPSWVSVMARFLSDNPEIDVLGGPCRSPAPPRFRVCVYCAKIGSSSPPPGDGLLPAGSLWLPPGGNQAVRKRVFDSVGLFDPNLSGYFDENEWQLRATASGVRLGAASEMWIWHRRDVQSVAELARKVFWQSYRGDRYHREASTGLQKSVPAISVQIARSAWHIVRLQCAAGFIMVSNGLGCLAAALVGPFINRRKITSTDPA
jgi:glycosyltransferase involved in cell wall biosynthesis